MKKNNLKKVAINEGVSQAELSRVAGLSAGTINRIMNQSRSGSLTTMYKILRALNKISYVEYKLKDIFPEVEK